jgi:hypothetical protein
MVEGLHGAGKRRLAGDTARAATTDEVKDLRQEARDLKEVVAEQTLELRLLKKSMIGPSRQIALKSPAGQWMGRPRMRYPASETLEIIRLVVRIASIGTSDVGQAGYSSHHILSLVRPIPSTR